MNFALNMIFISFLLGISLLYLYFLFKEGEREEEPFDEEEVNIPFDEDLFLEELTKRRAMSKTKTNVQEVTFDTKGTYGTKTDI